MNLDTIFIVGFNNTCVPNLLAKAEWVGTYSIQFLFPSFPDHYYFYQFSQKTRVTQKAGPANMLSKMTSTMYNNNTQIQKQYKNR